MARSNLSESPAAGVVLGQAHAEPLEVSTLTSLLLGPIAGFLVWFLPLDIDPTAQKALAIVAFMLVNWIAEPVDHAITAVIGCYLFWVLGVAKISVAFSGFGSSTPWFVFFALVVGEAASRTGLVKRIGYLILSRTGGSYSQLVFGVVVLSFLLNFLIPSALARVAVIAPMLIGIFSIYRLEKDSNIARGLVLILTYTNPLFTKMVMSGPAAILTRGIIEQQTGTQVLWSTWFLAFLPITAMTVFGSWLITRWLYPGEVSDLSRSRDYLKDSLAKLGPVSGKEKVTLAWISVAVILWMTDFLHHINPAMVMIGLGLILSLPRIGVLDAKTVKGVNYFNFIFTAGALSMGTVLMESKALDVLAGNLVGWVQPLLGGSVESTVAIYWGGVLMHLALANDHSFLATSLPLLFEMTEAHGYNPVVLGLIWAFAGSGNLFLYQSTVLVLGYSYGYFRAKDLLILGSIMTLLEGILLMVFVPLYWPFVGLPWVR